MTDQPPTRAEVGCDLVFEVAEHATLALQVAVATTAGGLREERLAVTLDGTPIDARELRVDHGGRVHVVACGAGRLTVAYRAMASVPATAAPEVVAADALVGLRQSRYCPSDELAPFAEVELSHIPDGPDRPRAIGQWVHDRLRYELGSSGPLDTAVHTLLAGQGVCRDFAHLTIALCRAMGIPARLASAYAPGLWPMDFHAVAEVAVDGRWQVIDATRLAPRPSLVRIATGRDAADTAFASTVAGWAELVTFSIHASTDGDLPVDDHEGWIALA